MNEIKISKEKRNDKNQNVNFHQWYRLQSVGFGQPACNCFVRLSCAAPMAKRVFQYLAESTGGTGIDSMLVTLIQNVFKKIEGVECLHVFHSIQNEVFPFIDRFLICSALCWIEWAIPRPFKVKWIGSIKFAHGFLPTFRLFRLVCWWKTNVVHQIEIFWRTRSVMHSKKEHGDFDKFFPSHYSISDWSYGNRNAYITSYSLLVARCVNISADLLD